MTTPRMLVLAMLVMGLTLTLTTTAHASGADAAEEFAYYLWEYFGW